MEAVKRKSFLKEDFKIFEENMASEIIGLREALSGKVFSDEGTSFGTELEFWLVDKDYQASLENMKVLQTLQIKNFVPEFSKFHVEYNGTIHKGESFSLHRLDQELKAADDVLNDASSVCSTKALLIGTMPNLDIQKMDLSYMTPDDRYYNLNEQIMIASSMKKEVCIERGRQSLRFTCNNIMPVTALSSFQMHYKMPYSQFADHYNASCYVSAILVAVSANSPYLAGKAFWEESRIPLFEQSNILSHATTPRVGMGYGFIEGSIADYYEKLCQDYEVYLPHYVDVREGAFRNCSKHNGTVWHWNRIVLNEASENEKMHARIEFRPCSSGPSPVDMTAHMALYVGLTKYFSQMQLEQKISFEKIKQNFYECAKHALDAEFHTHENKVVKVRELLKDYIDCAAKGLEQLAFADSEIDYYLYKVLIPRLESNKNAATWQKSFVNSHGQDFKKMLDFYWKQQRENKPLHLWDL